MTAPLGSHKLWSFRELSQRWDVTTDRLRHWKARGWLHTVKVGSWNYAPDAEVRRFELEYLGRTDNEAA